MQQSNSSFRKFIFGLAGVIALVRITFVLLEVFHQAKNWPLIASYFSDVTDPFLYCVFCTSFFRKNKIFRKTSIREIFLLFGTVLLILGVLSELMQKYHLLPGTYDVNDIISFVWSYAVILLCTLIDFFIEKVKRAID